MTASYSRYLLILNGAALLGCAVFDYAWRDTLLVALMLFLPFIDRQWTVPKYKSYKYQSMLWLLMIAAVSIILIFNPEQLNFILYTILLVALPEEWFFRAYFMPRIELASGNKWGANIIASALFAVLHVPVQGLSGLAVFVPSLVLGWLYQQRQDLVLVVLLHALSNLVYLLYIEKVLVDLRYYLQV